MSTNRYSFYKLKFILIYLFSPFSLVSVGGTSEQTLNGIHVFGQHETDLSEWKREAGCVHSDWVLFNPVESAFLLWKQRGARGRSEEVRQTASSSHVSGTGLWTTARDTQSLHWYSRIWPADNRDGTKVKTAHCTSPKSQRVPSGLLPHQCGCHGESMSLAAPCHTHVGTFCLSSSLPFFPLTFSPAVSQRGVIKKSFVDADSAWVCHGHLCSTCTVTKEGKNWKLKDFYSQNA